MTQKMPQRFAAHTLTRGLLVIGLILFILMLICGLLMRTYDLTGSYLLIGLALFAIGFCLAGIIKCAIKLRQK